MQLDVANFTLLIKNHNLQIDQQECNERKGGGKPKSKVLKQENYYFYDQFCLLN